jgi:hypothetical protein
LCLRRVAKYREIAKAVPKLPQTFCHKITILPHRIFKEEYSTFNTDDATLPQV